VKAILLAAGEGLRLRPLTETNPKPLLKVLGEPILKRSIDGLNKYGIEDFIIITNYLEDQIKDYIGKEFPNLNIEFIHQVEIKGTANALLLAKSKIEEEFLIAVNGDCIYSDSLIQKTVDAAQKGIISVGGKFTKEIAKYGAILTDDSNVPMKIIEKPSKEEIKEGFANIGIYSLSKEIFSIIELMEKNNSVSSRGEYEIPDAVNALFETNKYNSQLIQLQENDYWFDIGRPWNLLDANETLLSFCKDEREGTIEDGVTLKGIIIIKRDAIIRSGVYIEGPVFIDEGADIGPNCYIRKFSYLGKNSRIGNGCEIKNSIIEDNTHAAHLSYFGDSIVGPNCNFGAGTITANLRLDKKTIPVKIKGNKEDSQRRKLGAIVGEKVETGIGALLMPGIKIGSDSWIGAGTIVDEDIPSESIYFGSQDYTLRRKRKNVN
jgi:bifunctional UDP-N-acetylglucosamine pyrophosphorylase/glucosamine-1-phosphate N-acetyltransferase